MISVCIATYNGEKYIKDELMSILPQLSEKDEIVISDDGSTDSTISCIESVNDSRIVVIRNELHDNTKKPAWNVSKNFENALMHAKGDIIFLADQDDLWMPDKVEKCVNALKESDLVIHNMAYYYGDNLENLHRNHWNGPFRFKNFFLLNGKYYGCVMAFKRTVKEWALPFPDKLLIHDYWIGILAELCGKAVFIPQPLIKYRLHDDNVSLFSSNSNLEKLTYRLYTIFHYLWRTICVKMGRNDK